MPRHAPTSFTPHEVAVIEAALINAMRRIDLLDGAKVDFGDGPPVRLDHAFERKHIMAALKNFGFDEHSELHVPARPGLPQPGR